MSGSARSSSSSSSAAAGCVCATNFGWHPDAAGADDEVCINRVIFCYGRGEKKLLLRLRVHNEDSRSALAVSGVGASYSFADGFSWYCFAPVISGRFPLFTVQELNDENASANASSTSAAAAASSASSANASSTTAAANEESDDEDDEGSGSGETMGVTDNITAVTSRLGSTSHGIALPETVKNNPTSPIVAGRQSQPLPLGSVAVLEHSSTSTKRNESSSLMLVLDLHFENLDASVKGVGLLPSVLLSLPTTVTNYVNGLEGDFSPDGIDAALRGTKLDKRYAEVTKKDLYGGKLCTVQGDDGRECGQLACTRRKDQPAPHVINVCDEHRDKDCMAAPCPLCLANECKSKAGSDKHNWCHECKNSSNRRNQNARRGRARAAAGYDRTRDIILNVRGGMQKAGTGNQWYDETVIEILQRYPKPRGHGWRVRAAAELVNLAKSGKRRFFMQKGSAEAKGSTTEDVTDSLFPDGDLDKKSKEFSKVKDKFAHS